VVRRPPHIGVILPAPQQMASCTSSLLEKTILPILKIIFKLFFQNIFGTFQKLKKNILEKILLNVFLPFGFFRNTFYL